MRNASETSRTDSPIRMATFRCPCDLLDDFREVARLNERSLSQELRRIMAEHIERERARQVAA